MILKIKDKNGKEFGLQIYENNFDGEVVLQDTFHEEQYIENIEESHQKDDIFCTNDEMITIEIKGEL